MVNAVFLLKNTARTSVPSITEPPLIDKPIPSPKKNPPKTDINNLSSVIIGNSIRCTLNARNRIAKILLTANFLLIVENPIIKNGILIRTSKTDKGKFVISVRIREIPVTPPSINELGNKNPFSPKLADSIPIAIKKMSWTKCLSSTVTFETFLLSWFSGNDWS